MIRNETAFRQSQKDLIVVMRNCNRDCSVYLLFGSQNISCFKESEELISLGQHLQISYTSGCYDILVTLTSLA